MDEYDPAEQDLHSIDPAMFVYFPNVQLSQKFNWLL